MPAAPYADWSDVAAIWRPLSDEEQAVAGEWIDVASQQIRDEVPLVAGLTVDERLDSGSLSPATVRDVVRQMVCRIMKHPDSVIMHREEFGTFMQQDQFNPAVAGGEMFISNAEMARLMAQPRARKQTAFMIGGSSVVQPVGRSYPFGVFPGERPFGRNYF